MPQTARSFIYVYIIDKKSGKAILFLHHFFFYFFCIHLKPFIDIEKETRERERDELHEYVDMNSNTVKRRKKI